MGVSTIVTGPGCSDVSLIRPPPHPPPKCGAGYAGSRRWLETHEIADRADAVLGPARLDPHAGAHRLDTACVDGREQPGVGAVELHERPGERPVERLAGERGVVPCPRRDDAL